jgi:hypothetical protein
MPNPSTAIPVRAIRTPRAAAVAGLVFSTLYATTVVLTAWAFLWFIGAIGDRIGHGEDHFFATVFLGSGVLLVAMAFASRRGSVSTR